MLTFKNLVPLQICLQKAIATVAMILSSIMLILPSSTSAFYSEGVLFKVQKIFSTHQKIFAPDVSGLICPDQGLSPG